MRMKLICTVVARLPVVEFVGFWEEDVFLIWEGSPNSGEISKIDRTVHKFFSL
jgi:hypothetical protein